jgi:hypothetical protein
MSYAANSNEPVGYAVLAFENLSEIVSGGVSSV